MKRISFLFNTIFISVICFGSVIAHVVLDSPTGGETFLAGETVNIRWHIAIDHPQENWDLHFSPDGGNTWEIVQLDLAVNRLSYQWTIPQVATEHARIKIIMDNEGLDYDDTSSDFTIQENTTAIKETVEKPHIFKLYPNYPNPFNPTTHIPFSVNKIQNIKLEIYNISGQLIKTIINAPFAKGNYEANWNGTDSNGKSVSSGIYFSRLKGKNNSHISQLLLIK